MEKISYSEWPGHELVASARKCTKEKQKEFAERLGTSQANISRYENEEVAPPKNITNQCIKILKYNEKKKEKQNISAEKLNTLINERLSSKGKEHLRNAIYEIVSSVPKD